MADGALSGVRVLELGQFLSAPRCGRLLAEQGAEVIKIEPPHGEAMRLLLTMSGAERALSVINGDKKSVTLDLKSERGREVLLALVDHADVVVENFSPGALDRLGLSVPSLIARNPRLIVASISGFGQRGPNAGRLAFDLIAQATSGIMDGLGTRDRPPTVFFGDLINGGYAAMAVGFALYQREKTGAGQHLDISMQDVMYAHHFNAHSHRAIGDDDKQVVEILGRSMDNLITSAEDPLPFWNAYPTTDGFVALVAISDPQWRGLMRAIGRDDLASDERFSNFVTRVRNAGDAREIVKEWMQKQSSDDAVKALSAQRVPCGHVATREQVNEDPHLRERGLLAHVTHPRLGGIGVPGPAFVTDGAPAPQRAHSELGEHNDEVLRSLLGYGDNDMEALRDEGVL